MKPTREFFEQAIESSRKEQMRAKAEWERHEGIARFCQQMIEKRIFTGEGEKAVEDGMEHKETPRG